MSDKPGAEHTPQDVQRSYAAIVDRVDSLNGTVAGDEQTLARRVVHLARELCERERQANGQLTSSAHDLELRKELARAVEFLGRRGARAIASATLARVLLADLSGDRNSFRQVCRECDEKLLAFGL